MYGVVRLWFGSQRPTPTSAGMVMDEYTSSAEMNGFIPARPAARGARKEMQRYGSFIRADNCCARHVYARNEKRPRRPKLPESFVLQPTTNDNETMYDNPPPTGRSPLGINRCNKTNGREYITTKSTASTDNQEMTRYASTGRAPIPNTMFGRPGWTHL